MARSLKKGPYVDAKLLARIERMNQSGPRDAVQTWRRACTIVPEFIGMNFEVHNGKVFHKVFVTEDMVGHKLGEFSVTRNFRGHGGTKRAAG